VTRNAGVLACAAGRRPRLPWVGPAGETPAGRAGQRPAFLFIQRCLFVAIAAGWLASGSAGGSDHWAYQPVHAPAVPPVQSTAWPRNEIDRFILASLEQAKVQPSPDAEASALCRRIHFDLIGLPPSVEELGDFEKAAEADQSAAVVRLVDRLLESPRFGEHWARHWFDVARFAESVTLRGFIFKEAWRYRDYVIDAFNRDLPFDRFIREQIAGDLLPHTSLEQRQRQVIATTFLALGNTNLEEQDKKQLDMDIVDEQLDTIGKAFMAQTIGCARCHDHKFDPIPTRDYYAMAGILRNVQTVKHANVSEWMEVPMPVAPEEETMFAEHEAAVAGLESEIKSAKEAVRKLAGSGPAAKDGAHTPSVVPTGSLAGVVVDSAQARGVGAWKHSQHSRHYIGDGYWHDDNQGKGEKTLTFQPELGQAGWYEVRFAYSHGPSRATNVPVTIFHADGESLVAVNQHEVPLVEGRFASLGRFRFETNGFASVLVATQGTQGHVTADAVQFLLADSAPTGAVASPSSTGQAAQTPTVKEAAELKSLEQKLEGLKRLGPKRPKVLSVVERAVIEEAPIHLRGSVHTLGPIVPRGFLSVVMRPPALDLPANQSGRRELAESIARAENPLTARVFVNRVWAWLMGEGLVRSVDNFGTTGDPPSHPELLDHLAEHFVSGGWSTKKLVREIMLSRAYQSQSRMRTRHEAAGTRHRLTAEQLRDAMLAVSGELQLDPPHGPTFAADRAADFGFVFKEPRRSVYAPVFRNALPEIFEAFDFPSPSLVTGQRSASTTATQALFLMNHPFVRERAAAAARRLLAEPLDDGAARIDRAYRRALGRPPTAAECALALRHVHSAHGVGDAEAAWADLFQALFGSLDFRCLD
jgi:hypothetical protein